MAVISSAADLQRALRLRRRPDLFELRLDALAAIADAVEETLHQLGARLIITARHPAEGGAASLSTRQRSALLTRFLPYARYVDIELRSRRQLTHVFTAARERRVGTIVSCHDFRGTPPLATLRRKLQIAAALGADIFKVATRVDDDAQLARLLCFFGEASAVMPIAAMGIGRRGRVARAELMRRGSALNYGYLSRPQAPGQMSFAELRRR